MKRIIKFLFKGEVLFAGFLFSSVFKPIIGFELVDLTAVFMVLSMLVGLMRLYKDPKMYKLSILPIVLYAALTLLMLISFLYTPGGVYAQEKVLKFMSISSWSFLGTFVLIRDKKSLDEFLKGLIVYGSLTCLYTFYDYITQSNSDLRRIGVGEDNTNVLGLGRLAGTTALIILVKSFYVKSKTRKKILPLVLIAISIFILILTGSRMPFIALAASVILLVLLSFNFNIKLKDIRISKRLLGFLSLSPLIIIIFVYVYQKGFLNSMLHRLSALTQDGGGASVEARSGLASVALRMWKESPLFGNGVGSFPIYLTGIDSRMYPHNIFMEMLSETGVVGLFLLVTLIIISVLPLVKTKKVALNNSQIIVVLIGLFLLLNANSSGDLNDNRWLFTFLALASALPVYGMNNTNHIAR